MARLNDPGRDGLDGEGQRIYDGIVASRGAARGPFGVLMHHPALAERVAALGEQLRFHSLLSGADRELAILTAGREVEAVYEWSAHEPIGLREGTRTEAIAVVRERGSTADLLPREALIIEVVRALYRDRRLGDALYQRGRAELGEQALVELVVLAGYYGMIGFVLNAFEVDLPAGVAPAFTRG
jgi:4-carboxymuconolactone decarboxylase